MEFAMAMACGREVAGRRRQMGAKSSVWAIGIEGVMAERRVGVK